MCGRTCAVGCEDVEFPASLLACTNSYPASPEEMHLRRIPHLAETFDAVPSLSDHTLGTEVPVAGVSLGARIVEKLFMLSREEKDRTVTSRWSQTSLPRWCPGRQKRLLGEAHYETTQKDSESETFRRSLFVVENVEEGKTHGRERTEHSTMVRTVYPSF